MKEAHPLDKMPHSLDAEKAVLGTCLQYSEAIESAREILHDLSAFYWKPHQVLWKAILTLYDQGTIPDQVTLMDYLEKVGKLEEIGGPYEVASLVSETTVFGNVTGYAQIVADNHWRRRAIIRAEQIITLASDRAASLQDILASFSIENTGANNRLSPLRCLADVEPEEIDWLWYPRIPLGHLTGLEGDPGEGKSSLSLAIATGLSLGQGLPGEKTMEQGDALLFTAEDHLPSTVRPRLDAMGADIDRVFAYDQPFMLDPAGMTTLETYINKIAARLVVLDPVVAFLPPKLDFHRANEVRAVMAALSDIAERTHSAIVIVRHLAKGNTSKAIYRGLGSIDFTAACRSVLLVGHDPNDPTSRALVQIKSNLGPLADPLGYSIEQGQFRWTGATTLTAGQILAPEGDASQLNEAKAFLLDCLADGAQPSKEIEEEAKAADISKATLRRAKGALGVKARKEGQKGGWVWELPG